MKNSYSNFMKWLWCGGIVLCILAVWIALFASQISPNDVNKAIVIAVLGIIPLFVLYSAIVVFKLKQCHKLEEQEKQATLEKTKKEITTEFKKVQIKNSSDIDKQLFECQAKIDTDGKIICKIQLDFETKFDSYEEFMHFFNIDENS